MARTATAPGDATSNPEARLRNDVLARLADDEYRRLAKLLTLEQLQIRDLVYEVDAPIERLYFPIDCIVSVVSASQDAPAVEVATIGSEGMAGLPAFLGAASSPHRWFCQVDGQALVGSVADIRRFLADDGSLHRLLHLYTQSTIVQLAQNVACNRLHNTEQRAARWLLMCDDRVNRKDFPLKQEFMAQMLGVRRATVSEIASRLQERGLIRYRRGTLAIIDRSGLQRVSCDCYDIVAKEHARVMSQ
jgi:CRP-like cAMP-binding protein